MFSGGEKKMPRVLQVMHHKRTLVLHRLDRQPEQPRHARAVTPIFHSQRAFRFQHRVDQLRSQRPRFLPGDVRHQRGRQDLVRKCVLSRILQRKLIPFTAHPKQTVFRVYNCVDLEKLHPVPLPVVVFQRSLAQVCTKSRPKFTLSGRFLGE